MQTPTKYNRYDDFEDDNLLPKVIQRQNKTKQNFKSNKKPTAKEKTNYNAYGPGSSKVSNSQILNVQNMSQAYNIKKPINPVVYSEQKLNHLANSLGKS